MWDSCVSQRDWEILCKSYQKSPPCIFFPWLIPQKEIIWEDVCLYGKLSLRQIFNTTHDRDKVHISTLSLHFHLKNSIFLHFLILVWYEFTVQNYGGENEVHHVSPSARRVLHPLFSPEESCRWKKLWAVTALVLNGGMLSSQLRRRTVAQKWKLSLQGWQTLGIQFTCQKCNLYTRGQSDPLLKS